MLTRFFLVVKKKTNKTKVRFYCGYYVSGICYTRAFCTSQVANIILYTGLLYTMSSYGLNLASANQIFICTHFSGYLMQIAIDRLCSICPALLYRLVGADSQRTAASLLGLLLGKSWCITEQLILRPPTIFNYSEPFWQKKNVSHMTAYWNHHMMTLLLPCIWSSSSALPLFCFLFTLHRVDKSTLRVSTSYF